MEIEDIYSFIGNPVIVSRGSAYYNKGHVVQFEKQKNFIKAAVTGSQQTPYSVSIEFNQSGMPIETLCNCPYAEDNYTCKHIAAVLFYKLEENRVIENPIIFEKDKFDKDQVVKFEQTLKKDVEKFNCIDYIEQITLTKGNRPADQKFRLIFIISPPQDYYPYQWSISPKLQFIKKPGQAGRLEKFNEKKLSEPYTENEGALLYKLLDKESNEDALINHFEFLIKNKIPHLYFKNNYKYIPVTFEEIKTLNLKFKPSGYDTLRDSYYFSPVIEAKNKKGSLSEEIKSHQQILFNGFTIILIDKNGRIFYKFEHQLYFALLNALFKKEFKLLFQDIEELKSYFSTRYSNEINIMFDMNAIRTISPVPKPFIEIETISNGLRISLLFDYEGHEIRFDGPGHEDNPDFIFAGEKGNEYIVIHRNVDYEYDIHKFIFHRFKTVFNNYGNDYFIINGMDQLNFLIKYGREILNEGIEIRIKGEDHKITERSGSISINFSSGIDWFDLKANYIDSQGNVNNIYIDMNLLDKGLMKIDKTYTIIKKEDILKLQTLLMEGMDRDGKLRISKYNFHIIDELYNDITNNQDTEIQLIKKINERLKNFKKIEKYDLPVQLKGTLRNYQKAGYNWLNFLNKYELNGCLADDMGLGKTVQLLSLLQKLKEEKKLKTSLVVVPVTTIANWENEIKKFTPRLKYLLHFGQSRKKDIKHIKNYDIVIVSYHTLRNDIEFFNKIEYYYIILDESQNIKNYKSQVFRAVRTLKSGHRLSLTGTPVENNTLELWSQMDFLNPGLLGSAEKFKNEFTIPIEIKKDKTAMEKLKKLIFPFILRRKKEDVLKELPEKSEIILYSQMDSQQEKIYEQQKKNYQAKIMRKIERDGVKKSSIEILAALLRLRQIALFPSLVNKEYNNVSSCKFEHLKDIVDEILEEDHKILIFSQFVETLKIIEKYVKKNKFQYCYIDGSKSVRNRKEAINTFQENKDVNLFLLSLRAGGVGINLTAADYVILFDPWWNPAVETQAADRAHRIGQTRKVIVYKMIVKDTIEEKMLELQERKKNLVKELITTESSFFKAISKRDIVNLFK